jgi:transposase
MISRIGLATTLAIHSRRMAQRSGRSRIASMYVCILDQSGTVLVHKNLPTTPEAFLRVIAPYREDVVGGVECMFTWYWLADLRQKEGIAFVLGHALYMKAIPGGKAKNDKIDAHKIAVLLRGGMLPQA